MLFMFVSSLTVGKGGSMMSLTFFVAMFEVRFLMMLFSVTVPTTLFL